MHVLVYVNVAERDAKKISIKYVYVCRKSSGIKKTAQRTQLCRCYVREAFITAYREQWINTMGSAIVAFVAN